MVSSHLLLRLLSGSFPRHFHTCLPCLLDSDFLNLCSLQFSLSSQTTVKYTLPSKWETLFTPTKRTANITIHCLLTFVLQKVGTTSFPTKELIICICLLCPMFYNITKQLKQPFNPLTVNVDCHRCAVRHLNMPNDDLSCRQYCAKFGSIFFTPIPRTAQDFCVVCPLMVRAGV
jgi:hypothetical protein